MFCINIYKSMPSKPYNSTIEKLKYQIAKSHQEVDERTQSELDLKKQAYYLAIYRECLLFAVDLIAGPERAGQIIQKVEEKAIKMFKILLESDDFDAFELELPTLEE